jgi:polar amino acid transport system permease protein
MSTGERGGAQLTRAAAPTPVAIEAIPVRHWGRWVGGALVTLLILWLISAAGSTDALRWSAIPRYLFNHSILQGVVNTLILSILAQAMGIVLGVVLAIMRLSPNPVLTTVSGAYIWIFRGTPVLLQLLVWYNLSLIFPNLTLAIPFTGITLFTMPMNDFMTPLTAALLGLGLNEAAYMAEIVRAGIQSIDEGQTEAASALGMNTRQTMRRIVLPQAMRMIIPPTGNEFVSMLKLSSLALVVQYGELMWRARAIYTANLLIIELLLTISIWYLFVTSIASVGQFFLERRFARGTSRSQKQHPLERLWGRIGRSRREVSG